MLSPGQRLSGSLLVQDGAAVLGIVGAIQSDTAAQFAALLDDAIGTEARRVVIDMAGVTLLDADGMAALASAAQRLRQTGARLEIWHVTARIHLLLELAGLTEALGVAPTASSSLVRDLVGVAAVPHARSVLDAALKLVVTMAQAVVVGADGVSITLPRHGQLGTVASSNDVVLEMDHDQYDTGEGPCLDAAREGERFHIDSLDVESRWPAFVPRARARGIQSILSTPLMTGAQPVGALNVYSREVGAFAVHEKRWADQFAAEASHVVASAYPDTSVEVLTGQIQQALLSREVIAVAQGVVMNRDGLTASAAYRALRDISRRTGQPLRDVCEEVVSTSDDAASGPTLPDGSPDGRPTS